MFVCLGVYMCTMCTTQTGEGQKTLIPWTWSYRELWRTMWLLGSARYGVFYKSSKGSLSLGHRSSPQHTIHIRRYFHTQECRTEGSPPSSRCQQTPGMESITSEAANQQQIQYCQEREKRPAGRLTDRPVSNKSINSKTVSIFTLSANGCNWLIKRCRPTDWIRITQPNYLLSPPRKGQLIGKGETPNYQSGVSFKLK